MHTADSRPILIAFDDSDESRATVAEAARLFPGRTAIVVTVWRTIESLAAASMTAVPAYLTGDSLDKMDEAVRDKTRAIAESGATLAEEAGMSASAEPVESDGSIWPAIIKAADDHDAAAIVVGSRGRSGLKSVLLGSVSSGVVHHSDRPVVVVRSGGLS